MGFKHCLGHPWEFNGIVKAMRETGIVPDFIVVDGGEGGSGASPLEFSSHIGVLLREGLLFAHNILTGAGLRDQIRIGAAKKMVSAFDIASLLALGADWTNAARGFMLAIGCIRSLTCNTNTCPTGVATQDPMRQRALVVEDKAQRVCNFHRNTLRALSEMIADAGLEHPSQLRPHHLVRRVGDAEVRLFSQLHVFLEPGELLGGKCRHDFYSHAWALGRTDSFDSPPRPIGDSRISVPSSFLPELARRGGPRREASWWRGNFRVRISPPPRFARSPAPGRLGEEYQSSSPRRRR